MKKNISLIDNIVKLKTEKDAIILAHNYQIDEIQDIADFVGDSLQLSIKASKVKNKIIVFCGVHFMAETAKIISPERKVLLPDKYSGCPMADMITDKQLTNLKKEYPGAVVVCYVNTSARVKALSDICCTSSNAVKVVNSIPEDKQIIFIPDKYLGSYVQSQTGRKMILWNGFCPTHASIDVKTIIALKKEHLSAVVLVHPECTPDVIEIADKVASTGVMLSFVKQSTKKEFIIGTEIGLIYRLKKENYDKVFYPASSHAICPNMKLINLEKLLWALEEEQFEIRLPQDVIDKARTAIDSMLALS
ncbi:MAG: quinolinate synthase NadA [Actinobacteria bacterium]|nr:quinolinate synthase NadA [Actinomycetota bacterium]MBU4450904.1 quinolinate synthase NadA [Actinomycetota bacterium]MCG2788454.1 quinolinate synthase NadA [Actinomycetes bacterium]